MLAIRTYCLIEQILTEYQWCSDTRLGAGMSLVRERGKQLRHGVRNNYSTYCWRRHWYPTPVLLPGKSHGWRSLEGCSPWGHWVGHDWVTSLWLFTFMHWRRKWQPTPVFLPGESPRRGSLVSCHLWGRTESDTTEAIRQQQQQQQHILLRKWGWRWEMVY